MTSGWLAGGPASVAQPRLAARVRRCGVDSPAGLRTNNRFFLFAAPASARIMFGELARVDRLAARLRCKHRRGRT
jgi:hypothetical protein